jgi:hypothetical protein
MKVSFIKFKETKRSSRNENGLKNAQKEKENQIDFLECKWPARRD